jgi:cytochrome c oxidase assembly protein subunit 15
MDATAGMSGISQVNRRNIAIWLLVLCGMVAAMVVIGGITRLTESGLSIVEWNLGLGWIPPLSEAEWHRQFALYRQTSEYHLQFPDLDLEGFKTIFWWEYIHRVWGRLIGIVAGAGMLWCAIDRRIERRMALHAVTVFIVIALQGGIGYWMVTSGFVDRDDVSQYRLTLHLGLAIAIIAYMLWLALGLLSRSDRLAVPAGLKTMSRVVAGVAFVTILSGGMVAGINAGFIYNTWPLMDGGLLPDELTALSPVWLNAFENHAAVQFEHRILAYVTAILAAVMWFRARRTELATRARLAVNLLGVAIVLQLILGITTLLLVVPIVLAVLHQAGAVAVFALALWCTWEMSAPEPALA